MADILTIQKRSELMAKIPRKNTSPEMLVRRYLHADKFRYRLHRKDLPGTPDLILPKLKITIFVNGCFWHGHDECRKGRLPTSGVVFWTKKILKNKERDSRKLIN